ncbi:MAG: hypothetical protein C9356_05140 [Oleiphilus sp.]|nr:MAG: hypothetical protein C9356_05140 [Oleiphilus sp.]
MKTMKYLATAMMIGMFSVTAFAEGIHGNRYAGLSVGLMEGEVSGSTVDVDINHLEGRIGGYINEYLAAEGRLGLGITGDTVQGVDVDLNYLVGAYVRAGVPLSNNMVFPYVLLGFTKIEAEASGFGVTVDDDETDASLGLGVDLQLGKLPIALEYVEYVDKNKVSFSGFTVGLKFDF